MSDASDPRTADARLGSWLRGKYRLDRVLGEGGMAVVYAATHRNNKRFAVKMLHGVAAAQPEIQARFLREGYLANTVDHPGAVAVLDDDTSEEGAAFIVMELLEGATLEELAPEGGPRPSVDVVLSLGFQALDTLAAAHAKGIVHRDIKPANLFLTRVGQLKVLDFGIARLREPGSVSKATLDGSMLGTPSFMGPEQALGRVQDIDARTDVWAVGASLFWLLSGRNVHVADTVQHVVVLAATTPAPSLASARPDVPASVAAVVDRALAFKREDRWPSAAAMRDAIDEAHHAVFGRSVTSTVLAGLAGSPTRREASATPPGWLHATEVAAAEPQDGSRSAVTHAVTNDPGSTGVPVSSSRRETTRRSRPPVHTASIALLATAGVAVGWWLLRTPRASDSHATAAPSAMTAPTPVLQPEPVSAAPPSTGAPSDLPITPPPTVASATPAPKTVAPPARRKRVTEAVPTASATPPRGSSNEFDRQ